MPLTFSFAFSAFTALAYCPVLVVRHKRVQIVKFVSSPSTVIHRIVRCALAIGGKHQLEIALLDLNDAGASAAVGVIDGADRLHGGVAHPAYFSGVSLYYVPRLLNFNCPTTDVSPNRSFGGREGGFCRQRSCGGAAMLILVPAAAPAVVLDFECPTLDHNGRLK